MNSSTPASTDHRHYRAGVVMAVMGVVTAGGFGFAVIGGASHPSAAKKGDAELEQARTAKVEEADEVGRGSDAVRTIRERTQAAAARMKEAEDEPTVALGRMLEAMVEHTRAIDERLIAALDAVGSERFLKTDTMLANKDFAWQRATVEEYGLAAKNAAVVHGRLPGQLQTELAIAELGKAAEGVMSGFRRTWSLGGRVYHAHVMAAKADGELIDFLEKHAAEIEVGEDGSLAFEPVEGKSACDRLLEQSTAADAEVDAAVAELAKAVAAR